MPNFQDNVKFPDRCKPLPPGYKIIQLDSGHYMWSLNDITESSIHWDRWAVWRGVFAHYKENLKDLP